MAVYSSFNKNRPLVISLEIFSVSENRDYESPTSVIYKKVNARLLDCIVSGQMAKAIRTDICPENLIHMCWAVWDASEKVERIDDIEDKTDLIIDFAKEFRTHKQTSV